MEHNGDPTTLMDEVVHGVPPLLSFLSFEDLFHLRLAKRDYHKETSIVDPSAIATAVLPHSFVEMFLHWIHSDYVRESPRRFLWEFDDWLGTAAQRFDINERNEERDRHLFRLFRRFFGCSPLTCFEMYRSMLNKNCNFRPMHVLWACIKSSSLGCTSFSRNVSRAAEIVESTEEEFESKSSTLIQEVAELFDQMHRNPDPNNLVWPSFVNKSVLYLRQHYFSMKENKYEQFYSGYEFEIEMQLPEFANITSTSRYTPGYVSEVAVRYKPNPTNQSTENRELDFYQQSLKTRLKEDELVVVTQDPLSRCYDVENTIISQFRIIDSRGAAAPDESDGLESAIELESIRVGKIERKFREFAASIICKQHVEREVNYLHYLKFAAFMINVELKIGGDRF